VFLFRLALFLKEGVNETLFPILGILGFLSLLFFFIGLLPDDALLGSFTQLRDAWFGTNLLSPDAIATLVGVATIDKVILVCQLHLSVHIAIDLDRRVDWPDISGKHTYSRQLIPWLNFRGWDDQYRVFLGDPFPIISVRFSNLILIMRYHAPNCCHIGFSERRSLVFIRTELRRVFMREGVLWKEALSPMSKYCPNVFSTNCLTMVLV